MPHIVIATVGTHGHVNPALAVAEKLIESGHRVTFCTTGGFRRAVEATGATLAVYQSRYGAGGEGLTAMSARPAFAFGDLLKEAFGVLPQIERTLRVLQPDLLFYDRICMAAGWAAQRVGLQRVGLFTSYPQNGAFLIYQRHAEIRDQHPAPNPATLAVAEQEHRDICEAIEHEYGIKLPAPADMMRRADALNIALMPRVFHTAGDTFDERYLFVGPCIGSRREEPTTRARLRLPRRRLLITRGSILTDSPAFYRTCMQAFGNSDWEVFMAIGQLTPRHSLGPVPANFTLATHLPQISLLPGARAFVGAGGMNSTMEALHFGVPLVVLPDTPEQVVTADRVEQLRLGCTLDLNTVSAQQLRAGVEAICADARVLANTRDMQQAIREAGGASRAAAALDDLFARHYAPPVARVV